MYSLLSFRGLITNQFHKMLNETSHTINTSASSYLSISYHLLLCIKTVFMFRSNENKSLIHLEV